MLYFVSQNQKFLYEENGVIYIVDEDIFFNDGFDVE